MLRAHAERQGDAIALIAPEHKPLTYSRLLRQVEESAAVFAGLGLRPSDRVSIVLPNGPEMAASFLATAAIATCAPLNPAYRANEFEIYLSDLKPKFLVMLAGTASPARDVAQKLGIAVIDLVPVRDGEAGTFDLSPCGSSSAPTGAPIFAEGSDIALMLHTSGTTSRPKMVPLTQDNLCSSARNISISLALGREDRCLNVMPLFHIHGLIGAVLSSIDAGASVVCAPEARVHEFFDWVDTYRPSWYTAVPSIHAGILPHAQRRAEVIERAPLRFIRSCSAPMPPSLMAELEQAFRAPVLEAYGMTEASHQIACNPLPPAVRKPGSVGIPTGTKIAIMDQEGRLVASGETGEIVIRGPNVMVGYLENPAANQTAFADGWLRTGDLGHLDSNGYLFISGRAKEIINRGGEKISPREVEEILLTHPVIAEAVVFAIPHSTLGEEVGAAVVLRPEQLGDEVELRAFIGKHVAPFKVPRRIFFLAALPKGATGKPQRIGLADKLGLGDRSGAAAAKPVSPPRADVKTSGATTGSHRVGRIVKRAWTKVLDSHSFAADLAWEDAGGDSLKAMEFWFEVERALGRRLPWDQFAESTRPSQLVAAIDALLITPSHEAPAPDDVDKPTLFVFPGIGGDDPRLMRFRAQFGKSLRCELIDYPDWRKMLDHRMDFESLIDAGVAQVGARSRGGRCFLVGFSYGGFIAFAAAQRLIESGHTVDALILLDSRLATVDKPVVKETLWQRMRGISRDPWRLLRAVEQRFITLCFRRSWFGLLRTVSELAMSFGSRFTFVYYFHLVTVLRTRMLKMWCPTPLRVPTVLLQSAESLSDMPADFGWGRLCNPLELVRIGGTHESMLDPPLLAVSCEQILKKVAELDEERRSSPPKLIQNG